MEVVKLAESKGSYYDLAKHRLRLPEYAAKDVSDNGAVYLTSEISNYYEYLDDPQRLGLPHTRKSKVSQGVLLVSCNRF